MLQTERGAPPESVPGAVTRSRDATEVLFNVLRGVGSYDACILEAERDGDLEVASFLRELRRQDLARAREAARLLRRSPKTASGNV
jgi:hypothetical protein